MGLREVDVAIKRQHEGSLWSWNCSSLDCINVSILILIPYVVLQDVSIRGNWVKGTEDLSALFHAVAPDL